MTKHLLSTIAILLLTSSAALTAAPISHTEENPIKIWGWSKDGKVAISELKDAGGRGGVIIRAFVLNVVRDTAIMEQTIDSFNFDDGNGGIPENELNTFFKNFHNVCRQQFGINAQEERLLVPANAAFRHNGKTFNVTLNADKKEDDMIVKYSVIVETGNKRKTILSTSTFLPTIPVFYRYSVSPFEDRALVIAKWNGFSESYGFVYAGCHLVAGFK